MWVYLSSFSLAVGWQFTPSFEGTFIRVSHTLPGANYGRGLIAQADSSGTQFFQTKRLYLKQAEKHIFEVIQPAFFSARTIALKGYIFPAVPWTVDIEVWQSPGVLIKTVSASITQVLLIEAGTTRQGVGLYNDSPATLYIALGANVTTAFYDLILQPGGYYETPFDYKGQIIGVWSAAIGDATVQEFF